MESLHAARPLHLGEVVLIPVQGVLVELSRSGFGLFVRARSEPCAIVVGRRGSWRAYDPGGAEIAIDGLLARVTGLGKAIRSSLPD